MKDYAEELELKLFLITENAKRRANIWALRNARYDKANLVFEDSADMTEDFKRAVSENSKVDKLIEETLGL